MNKNKIKLVTFDLDGTLINSYRTIYYSTIKALEDLGIKESIEEPEFYKRIGHHFVDIFNDLKIPVPDFEVFINIYKSHYFDFIDTSELYDGVEDILKFISENDYKVSLLTTKGEDQAIKIIEHFKLDKYFSLVTGRREGIAVKPSAEPLEYICNKLSVAPENTLMIGDTELDIQCGKNAKALTCWVKYGYRSEEQILNEKPDYVISKIGELKALLS